MSVSELPPIDTSSDDTNTKSKKSKKSKKKPAKKEVVVEEVAEEEVGEEEAAEEKAVAPKKKTGAQKRKEKKAKEEAEKKETAKSEKKKDSGKKKAPEKTASKQKIVEDEWNVVSDDKKVKGNSAQSSEPTVEETKPVISEKQKKKAAKARAEKQRENAKKNDTAYLDNLPEEIKAQLAKFAPVSAAPVTAAVINDEWTDIAVKTTNKPKKSVVEAEEIEEATAEAPVKKSRPQKVIIYKDASQSEIFKPVGDRKDDDLSKYSFKGLEASW